MKSNEFTNAENDINFIKFMLDKTWHAVKTEAEKKAEIKKEKEKIAKQDKRTKEMGINLHQRNNPTNIANRPKR